MSETNKKPRVIISFGVTTHGSSVELLKKDNLSNVRWISPECEFCSTSSTSKHASHHLSIAHSHLAKNLSSTRDAIDAALNEFIEPKQDR